MPQFGLPHPNDNVLEVRIEWDSISNRDCQRSFSILETKLYEEYIFFIHLYSVTVTVDRLGKL